jgi:transcriptional regulator with XRE-family HTH domain
MMMRPVHLRMARAALGWTLQELANKADVNMNTISRYETGKEVLSGTLQKIEDVLKNEGIVFIEPDERSGFGIRLKLQRELLLGTKSSGSDAPARDAGDHRATHRNSKTKPKS